ncbi:DUF4249 domain-containing protein [Pedobacter insulae]|uniref:DUF4249 domain-containing protein n=1 Tax=Pedobacter insulae TaxID=414048 RepID=A0A1I2XGY3_9SPHI|nr:DUF4249 domain-containing protein [Pedobacter insulae]SFH11946.1 protein of unknown function [Pedobacter insulae]
MKRFNIYLVGLVLSLIGCKEPFTPETTSKNSNILVVEGFINAGLDSTIIKLSRTVILTNKNVINPETGATLIIETSANEARTLVEKEKGLYVTSALNFGVNKKYRLKIRTNKGANYVSDFVDARVAPPIDSVNYVVKPEGLQLYVNASDPANNTRYYRWEYEESWIFYSRYNSSSIWKGGPIAVERYPEESIFKCWGNAKSSTILLGSSIKLSKDVIHLSPLTDIVSSSERLTEKYSILVKQYALNKETYEFWQNLKKNTESLGSIFDVLPSQLTGNIRNEADGSEPVIGYISAGTTQQRRIFIEKSDLPKWQVKDPYGCMLPDTVPLFRQKDIFPGNLIVPIEAIYSPAGFLIAHLASSRACVDCTIRGTVKKPIFWQ